MLGPPCSGDPRGPEPQATSTAARPLAVVTGSIAGVNPGIFQAVCNAPKAFLGSFSFALRQEMKDGGITITCLMPGATETEFLERADTPDTRIRQSKKNDRTMVETGMLAEQHRTMTEAGSAPQR